MAVSKKPWRKVGRLEHRIIHLENQIEALRSDLMEEMNMRARDNKNHHVLAKVRIDKLDTRIDHILADLRTFFDNLIN